MLINLRGLDRVYNRQETEFKGLYSEEDRQKLLGDSSAFNGKTVRLDSYTIKGSSIEFNISEGEFYDLLTTNILLNKQVDDELKGLQDRLIAETLFLDEESTLSHNVLANAIAISVLIRDNQGRYLITERSGNVAISNNYYGVSATAGLDDSDYGEIDPIIACIKRELEEELNIKDDGSYEIDVVALYIDDIKFQPSILVNVQLSNSFDDWDVNTGVDFKVENSGYILTDEALLSGLDFLQMTQAAYTHLQLVVENYYNQE